MTSAHSHMKRPTGAEPCWERVLKGRARQGGTAMLGCGVTWRPGAVGSVLP